MGEWNTIDGRAPIIIAHRGASGYLPEHTLASYDLAITLGADYIEPDLVITKDGHLVARHDRYLSTTTDIENHKNFADRFGKKPGHDEPDWFVEDFTLAELKTLRARQPRAGRSLHWDGQFTIPTYEEILQLAVKRSREAGRRIGVYPETKHPALLEAMGLVFDDPLLRLSEHYGYRGKDDLIFIQSFEYQNLQRLRGRTNIKQIYLIGEETKFSFYDIAEFADGVGPYKKLLKDENGQFNNFIKEAHEAKLAVHPWTFRDDDVGEGYDNSRDEIADYCAHHVDGFFTDFTDTGFSVRALAQFL